MSAWNVVSDAEYVPPAEPGSLSGLGRRLLVVKGSQVRARRWRWVWDRWMVLGGLTLLAGREGLGKSTVAVDVAAQVTLGQLAGELQGSPRTVLYIASEDSREHTIVPRFLAAGADMDRVLFLDVKTETTDDGMVVMPLDNDQVEQVIRDHQVALVVLDAATSVMAGGLDGHDDRKVRQFLEPLAAMGTRTECSVLGVCHFGKRESGDTGKLILGSIAWSQVARSVLAVAQDAESGNLVISNTKKNLAGATKSLGARIVSATVDTDDGPAEVGAVQWLGETDQHASDFLAGSDGDDEREDRDQAAAWLEDYLEAQGRAKSGDVKKAAVDAGFSTATLGRVRRRLGILVKAEGFPRVTYWSLPAVIDAEAEPAPSGAADSRITAVHVSADPTETTGRDLHKHGANLGQSDQLNHAHVREPTGDPTGCPTHPDEVIGASGKCMACLLGHAEANAKARRAARAGAQ